MAEKSKNGQKASPVLVPLEFVVPEGLVGNYATHFVVQATEKEIYVSFFAVQPPIILEEKAEPPKSVKTFCVSKVVIDPERMQDLINAMQTTLTKYLEQQKQ